MHNILGSDGEEIYV